MTTAATELEILRKYGGGHDLAAIAAHCNVSRDQVSEVVSAVGFERGRAREQVRQREAAPVRRPAPAGPAPERPRRQTSRPAEGARLVTAAVGEPDADKVVTADRAPSEAVTTTPPPPPAPIQEIDVQPQPDTIDQVLLRAAQHPRLKSRVDRVRQLVDALRTDLAEVARVAEAEQRIEQLRAQLAKATQDLKDLTRSGKPVNDGPDAKTVRTWAARNGVDCTTSGKVPKAVVEQYLAAQAAA